MRDIWKNRGSLVLQVPLNLSSVSVDLESDMQGLSLWMQPKQLKTT
jgi:hypothetical protein